MRLAGKRYPGVGRAGSFVPGDSYESQQPEVMRTKRDGLVARYGVTQGHDYFEVHEALDVEHSAAERQHIERLARPDSTPVLEAVRQAFDATYTLLDGPERLRQISSPRLPA